MLYSSHFHLFVGGRRKPALENLLIYIEEKIMNLFEEDGDLASSKTIKRDDVIDVLDNIPPSLLAKLRNKTMTNTTTLEVQTDETYD